jgi:L-ascorbate metabolism protein UlaG (beta-lactamase superfamily)
MDPVFEDPFEEGAVVSCPKRRVHADKLPKLDLVIISHAHLDHFDVPTLARLPRDVEVMCPEDRRITYALEQLGFEKVRPVEPSASITFDGFELFTTLSSTKEIQELGVVFKDASGSFWNQVDTVIVPGTIELVRMQAGHVDLAFVGYASQNFGFFGSMRSGYPIDVPKRNLDNVKQLSPGLVVPASAGFRFAGPFEWTNRFLFPISRKRFMDDLDRVAPEIGKSIGNPGDVFEIEGGKVTRHAAASPFAEMVEDDLHLIDFDATAGVPPLTDPNALDYPIDELRTRVERCFDDLESLVRNGYKSDPIVDGYRTRRISYGLGVLFPDGSERFIRFELGGDAPTITRGDGMVHDAMTVQRIAASALVAWIRCERSYYWYRGFSRRSMVCPAALVNGKIAVPPVEPPDLLTHWLDEVAPTSKDAWKKRLDARLAPYVR